MTKIAHPLEPGTVLAQVMFEVYSGREVTIVDSPPGAGKSTLIADLTYHLDTELPTRPIVIAAFTRDAAANAAAGLGALLGPGRVRLDISSWPVEKLPHDVESAQWASEGEVALAKDPDTDMSQFSHVISVRTLSSLSAMKKAPTAGEDPILIVDEAYQATFSLVASAAQHFDQIVLVGDPGQIGPVITADTRAWDSMAAAPHMRAPEVFEQREGSIKLHLSQTYRLGQDTVDAISPLYGFPFTSLRPARKIRGMAEIRAVRIPATQDPYSFDTALRVVDIACDLIGEVVKTKGRPDHVITESDIAIVVSHNAQQAAIEGSLASRGIVNLEVGTADRLQGGQWHAVVALDPLVGHAMSSDHSLSSGRLCVMASRHMTHLTWVHDGQWKSSIRNGTKTAESHKGYKVRKELVRIGAPKKKSKGGKK